MAYHKTEWGHKPMLAVDHTGRVMWLKTHHPRKELMERCGNKHCSKMYIDRNGLTFHVGYVIGRQWWTICETVERPA